MRVAYFIYESGWTFYISYMKTEVHISYIKMVQFSIFHIWKSSTFHIWKWENFLYFIYENSGAYFIYENDKISFTSYMKIEWLNKKSPVYCWLCLDVTMCFLQWEHLDLTLFCALVLETWVGPGLPLSWKTPGLRLNVSAQMSGVWSWRGCSGQLALLWGGSVALPGSGLQWALSLSPCLLPPPWGMEAPQVGYLVIIPIFQHIQVE